jgi:outer membrane protein TolC
MQQDLLKANVELAMEEARLAVLREKLPAGRARVNALLNRPPDAELGRPAAGDSLPALPILTDIDALRERAVAEQPMLRMKERAIARDELRARLARKEGLPDFMLSGGVMLMKDEPDAWMGMVGMTLPIWRGTKVAPVRREAEAGLASSRAERERAENEVLLMVSEAWTMGAAARTMMRLYADSVLPQAEQAVASARAAYATSRASFLDLLDAQRSLLQFRLAYEEAVTEYLKSRADLALAVGDRALLGVGDE